MLPQNKVKEELSLAYVMAVAAKNGFVTDFSRVDYDSVDAKISCSGKLSEDSIVQSPEIHLQLKATADQSLVKNDGVHFPLPVKNYNDLRSNTAVPRLLVVLLLPENAEEWLSHSPEHLILKKCAYYLNLKGRPQTENQNTETVIVPLSNLFSPEALGQLMLKASMQDRL
jgi:hypothetical protein